MHEVRRDNQAKLENCKTDSSHQIVVIYVEIILRTPKCYHSSFRIERVKTETVSFIPAFWFQRIRLVIVSETFFTGTTETSIHLAFIRKIGRSVMLKRLKSHSIYFGSFQ